MREPPLSPSADSAQPAGAERRQTPRHRPAGGILCSLNVAPTRSVGPVTVANLSAGGIGLVCPPGIPVPAAFTIRLYRRGEPSWSEYPVGMVYAHRLPGGALAVGGKFARDLPADELQGFL